MPTAAKLISALVFAGITWLVAFLYAQGLSEGRPPAGLLGGSVVIGLLCGWIIMGRFASRPCGRVEAMGTGLRTAFTSALAVLFVFALAEMLKRSMKGRYSDPMQAVLSVFDLMLTQGQEMISAEIMAVLLLGGLLGGALAHWAGRTWR